MKKTKNEERDCNDKKRCDGDDISVDILPHHLLLHFPHPLPLPRHHHPFLPPIQLPNIPSNCRHTYIIIGGTSGYEDSESVDFVWCECDCGWEESCVGCVDDGEGG